MTSSYRNFNFIILFVIELKIKLILNIINDNYQTGILEEGNYDLLDFTDYHNLKLTITTSKKIYKGVPPQELIITNANLINATSLITYSENYLLAACTQDYFLINLNILSLTMDKRIRLCCNLIKYIKIN